jgi:hypothetical protein
MNVGFSYLVAFLLSPAVAFLPQYTSVLSSGFYSISMMADDNPQNAKNAAHLLISLSEKLTSSPKGDKTKSACLVLASQSPRRRGTFNFSVLYSGF